MKKLLSILLALGLVLGMVVAAVPVMADVDDVTVVAVPQCELVDSEHTITFTPSALLDAGSNHIFIQFPAGTGFPEDLDDLDVTVNAIPVLDGEKWLVNATTLKVMVPALVPAGVAAVVVVSDVVNPPAGRYGWYVWTDRPADETPISSALYRIYRTVSTYTFDVAFGFDPTASVPMAWDGTYLIDTIPVDVDDTNVYTGLATNFVPPFKACGQDAPFGWDDGDGTRYTPFELTLRTAGAAGIGCRGYERAIVNFWLEDAPYGSTATLYLFGWDGDDITTLGWHEYVLEFDDDTVYEWGYHGATPPGFELAAVYDEQTPGMIHFDVVGEYEICFELEDLSPDPCSPDPILAEMCISGTAHQEKDSTTMIEIDEKWNLISLPMVPLDSSIESVFAPWMTPGAGGAVLGFTPWDFVKAIYHYDNLTDKWFFYSPTSGLPAEYQQLNEMEDGKGYWLRTYKREEFVQMWGPILDPLVQPTYTGAEFAGIVYDYEGPGSAHWAATPLWIFGTWNSQAPNPPLGYAVEPGWTMMGFTSAATALTANYLSPVPFDTVFGFIGGAWEPNPVNMNPGQGYWVYFTDDGTVVPYP